MKEYYAQEENYISVSATVSHIAHNDENDALYYGFSDINYLSPQEYPYHFEYYTFIITGLNYQIVQANGIENIVQIGDELTFVAAPRYFYDGYAIPIVALSKGDRILLDYEDGFPNLLKWLETDD